MIKSISLLPIRHLVTVAVVLALLVVMLGAYTRLTDAGLGCPDWPGCYGKMILPDSAKELNVLQNQFAAAPIEAGKAWTEMIHRYAAGLLALLIFISCGSLLYYKLRGKQVSVKVPVMLIFLVLFQAALGMWTVTMKLLPIVVMGHLLGGILIFSLLSCMRLQLSRIAPIHLPIWHYWLMIAAIIIFGQIALGGWVSANYAGIACIGFPTCNNQWLPELQLKAAFDLFSPLGTNYQGGVLDNPVRVTIQYIHRLGAVITFLYLFILSTCMWFKVTYRPLRYLAAFIGFLVIVQILLGIMNVIYLLPLAIAVAHNGVAALLMASILLMLSLSFQGSSHG